MREQAAWHWRVRHCPARSVDERFRKNTGSYQMPLPGAYAVQPDGVSQGGGDDALHRT